MMSVWSHRPPFLHLGIFIAAYVLAAGFAQLLAIVPGTGISVWPPSGLFIATLLVVSRHSWPWWVLAGFLAELFGNVLWFRNPLPVAVLIYAGNALEAVIGAWLVDRIRRRPARLEPLQEVLALVVLGAGIAPVASATVGSATLAWFGIQSFATAWPLWWIGDATGVLLVAPPALVVFQNWRHKAQLSTAQWIEAGALGLIFLGAAALSLSSYYLPFAYIIMPPLLWAAVRFEFKGVAVALSLLALLTVALTISGASQFVGDPESQRQKQVMLHLFLAISAFSALIVAAISRQHQQALLTLRENEGQLQQLIDAVPAAIARRSPDGELTFFNKRMIDFLGLDVTDTDKPGASRMSAVIQTLVHPDDAVGVKKTLEHAVATGDSYTYRYRMRRADGVYRWMETRGEPLRDRDGAIVQWCSVSIDVEDEVRAQAALREREAKIRRLVDSDIIGIVIWDLDGRVIEANDAFLRMVQYERADVEAGLRWFDMTPPEWQDVHAREEAEELAATGRMQAREKEYFRKDGSRVPVLIGAACFEGQPRQGVAYILDLTERKRAEAALRDRERELSQLVNMVPVHIRRMTPQGEPIFFNKRLMDFFGLGDIADLDKPGTSRVAAIIQTLVHPDDSTKLLETARRCFAAGEPFSMKYRMRRADGAYCWVDTRAEPLRNQSGEIMQWYVVSIEIDDEVRAQQALRDRERELAQLVDMLPVYIRRLTPEGEPIFFNKRLTDYLGVGLAEIGAAGTSRLAPAIENFVHPDDAAEVMAAIRRAIATGEDYAMKYRMRGADGVYRWIATRAEPVKDRSGAIVQWYSVSIDIEDEIRAQQAEEALRETSNKLAKATHAASLSELSASIAHEVNQPLAAIVANSHACQRWLSAEPANVERAKITVERIIRDANSAADVVSRIRALFRQTPYARSSEDVNRLIGEVCRLVADEIAAKDTRIETNLEPGLPPVALDRVQVQQVLVNLIRNGLEAMDTVVDRARALQIRSCRNGAGEIRVEVRDAGTGFKDAERVFEPFFTTKHHGMGMGLAICRSIVESHGGRLWTANNDRHGAIVAFTLPLAASEGGGSP